ncbi:MAG: dTDP-4-dehydrorhamnose 3,5-epimerase [Candidatus Berkelbacteria bacterium Athens1014_28]|uniref:dTDP-4-dehydrorhamnose 3,5-epimerase n=1 Tax=Candidatus Berkelbacteria bacterium Athens1014_28 TaxID=2017145 RepID=A0A554LL99_9BACT|nr:MAG: dTDP-4-dehydrorhamnose 3,5-epimerase [Candidatus Berkelbacteria bacterium Athens1014_28]
MAENIENGKIAGVKIKKLTVWKDKPDLKQDIELGSFMEVLRDDDGLLKKFGQSNFTIAHKGTIKAFHWHKFQDDFWFLASGKAAIVLYDKRDDSPTKGVTEIIYGGTNDYKLVLIPVGVVHGYKVLSDEPCLLFYHVTKSYNPENPDEERIDPFDKKINFDWESLK